ncbi:hypothetical protein DFH28DRAFT_1088075 [Melampsora americana]|nr:hypothetical protein DFH28DRAFT_1088075 [Melampsora americana]
MPTKKSPRSTSHSRLKSKSRTLGTKPASWAKLRESSRSQPQSHVSGHIHNDNKEDEDQENDNNTHQKDEDTFEESDLQLEEEDDEDDSIMDHLARHFYPAEPTDAIDCNNLQKHSLRSSNTKLDKSNTVLPTIENYQELVEDWPPARIAVVDSQAIQQLYKQHKSLLAIMGNVSMYTMDKALGELRGQRRPTGYQIWLKFSKEIQQHQDKMPLKGTGPKGVLAAQNQILGDIWKVFSPPIFHALSGLQYSQHGERLEDNEDEQNYVFEFEPGEREELQVLYDELVWKEKVAEEYSRAVKGVPQIDDESKNMGFDYYLLACSTHTSTKYTSLEEMSRYVNKKSNFATMFAARSQGLSVGEIVAETIGGQGMLTDRARKLDPGDVVKGQVAFALQQRMTALLGYELDKGYNIKILQLPGSKLPYETLKLGFNAMNSRRSLLLDDFKANLFKLEKIGPSDQEEENSDQMDIEEEVTNTQNVTIDDELNENTEWTGLGDLITED